MPVADLEYVGFGAVTPGGTGQTVVHVTNLNSSGAGSLREAVSASNRFVVFDLAGTINVLSGVGENEIRVLGHHITIAGETAPSPGITIVGRGIILRGDLGAHDVIVRYLRIQDVAFDCVQLFRGAYNIILDHLSLRNPDDGGMDISGDAQSLAPARRDTHDITVSYCFIGAGSTGTNKTSLLAFGARHITLYRTLYGGHQRNPQIKWNVGQSQEEVDDGTTLIGPPIGADTMIDMRNCLIWGWLTQGTWIHHGASGNVIGCYFSSPDIPPSDQAHCLDIGDPENDYGETNPDPTVRDAFIFCYDNFSADNLSEDLNAKSTAPPFPSPGAPTTDPWTAAPIVREQCGMFPRDATELAFFAGIVLEGRPRRAAVQVVPTFAASRAKWGDITLDFAERTIEATPAITVTRGVNAVQTGRREYLFSRFNYSASVSLLMEDPEYQAFLRFWRDAAGPGGTFEFWLDRHAGSVWSFERTLADQNGLTLTLRNAPTRIPYADVTGGSQPGRGLILDGNRDLSVVTNQLSAPVPSPYDDPFDYREGVVAVRVLPAFAGLDGFTRAFVDTTESLSPPDANRILLWKDSGNLMRFDIWDGTGLNSRVYHQLTAGDTWSVGQGLEFVARWTTDGQIAGWYAVDNGPFTRLELADTTGSGIMTALPPRLLIGARNDQGGRAAGTYSSVAFWKKGWPGDTPWKLFAARRPVWRNYYGLGELVDATLQPDRPVLTKHLWQVALSLRSSA